MSPLRRWLTHRSRVPRSLRAAVALLLGAAALEGLSAPASPAASPAKASTTKVSAPRTKEPFGPGAGNPTKTFSDSARLRAQGEQLYAQSCSSCHGL